MILLIALGPASGAEIAPHEQVAHEDVFTGFKFPRLLGSFTFQNRVEYARVDLGYGVNYVERGGATATISVYDLNQHGIVDGTGDARVVEEFGRSTTIAAFARQGGYRGVAESRYPSSARRGCGESRFVRADGRRVMPLVHSRPTRQVRQNPNYDAIGGHVCSTAHVLARGVAGDRHARIDLKENDSMGPLAGVRIIEIAGIGAAPYGCMMLADMGAEVVRIDRPGGDGDTAESSPLLRNRRSMTLT
jgi:hypothetical protein